MSKSKINRREFLGTLAIGGVLAKSDIYSQEKQGKIDRYALVTRHNPVLKSFDLLSPLSVGNGEFAFTVDPTGLQTFDSFYRDKMPLCTMAQWGWHTAPNPKNFREEDLKLTELETYGRKVGYMVSSEGQKEAFDWLRQNPHRLHLGKIGFKLSKADGSEAQMSDVSAIEQKLDLWKGVIYSRFKFENKDVVVKTAAHPTLDAVAVSVESPLISEGKLHVRFAFPYGAPEMHAANWTADASHQSTLKNLSANQAQISRKLDADVYAVNLNWHGNAKIEAEKAHHFLLKPQGNKIEFLAHFTRDSAAKNLPNSAQTFTASENYWKNFWSTGGAVELNDSRDGRAKELERRIVLSQYLTAIQCAGSLPPQETGLTSNSWYGKFHLEMHWWHAAHFALWNRTPMLEKSLDWYLKVLPSARERAKKQGYQGVRWAKMTAPDGRDSPSNVGTLLIWQQPHPIFYVELCYQSHPNRETLLKYQPIIEETAKFMADYAHFDAKTNRYVLGPPAIPAQENHPARETWNPTYELEYWRYALNVANEWRERLGLKREAKWDDVVAKLSKLPVKDGVYLAHENSPQTFTERNHDHPSMLMAYGVLRGEMVDRETMRRTLKKVMEVWQWETTWGWDYPVVAMTSAKLGERANAIDALLLNTPKNGYSINGHNYQRQNLPLYLPGNGGLLYAIALMAAGWKDAPNENAPGFPKETFTVRWEGLNQNLLQKL